MDTAAELVARLGGKWASLASLETKRQELVGRFLDAPESRRPALVQERALLAAEHLALTEEASELQRRYAAAVIAPFEEREAAALVAVSEAGERATQVRLGMNAGIEEQRLFLSLGRREESKIAADAVEHARWVSERLHAETEAERESLARLAPGEVLA